MKTLNALIFALFFRWEYGTYQARTPAGRWQKATGMARRSRLTGRVQLGAWDGYGKLTGDERFRFKDVVGVGRFIPSPDEISA